MRQFQESIRPSEGIPAGLQRTWDLRWMVQEYRGSNCAKFGNTSERRRELSEHLGAPGSAGDKSRCIKSRCAYNNPQSACAKSGSTSNHGRAVWETWHLLWERCLYVRKSLQLLILQQFQNSCIQFVFSSMNLWIYIATHLYKIYQDWLQPVLESNARCAWKWRSSDLSDTLRGRDSGCLEMHLEAVIERIGRYTWTPWSSKLVDALGGHDRVKLEDVIEWVWRYT